MKEQRSAITDSTQAVPRESRGRNLLSDTSPGKPWSILWIDGVGGFGLVEKDEVVVGQASSGNVADIAIVGDLRRRAAAIKRVDGDYLLQPLQQVKVDGVLVDRAQLLGDQALIQLGERIKMQFRKPSPLSGTARLELCSLNRFKPNVDGILLLSDSCILGPGSGSHVVCPTWSNELLLFRHPTGWFFRSMVEVNVNGKPTQGQIPLVAGMRMDGEDFSLSVE